MRINGLILSESTHEEVVNVMTLKKSLTLNVRCKFISSLLINFPPTQQK